MGTFKSSGEVYHMCELFAQFATEASGGRLTFRISPGSTVADPSEHIFATRDGIFDMSYSYEGYLQTQYPLYYNFSHLVGLKGEDDVWKLAHMGGWNDFATEWYAENMNIAYVDRHGFVSDFMLSKEPVPHVADLQGLKGRYEGSTAEAFALFGGSPVFVGVEDKYLSLSSGLVDCIDIAVTEGPEEGYFDIAKYLVIPNLALISIPMLANLDFWNTLSEGDQALLTQSFSYASEVAQHEEAYNTAIILAKAYDEYGVTVHYWDEADQKAWRDAIVAATPVYTDDPDWVETNRLLTEYAQLMGY